MAKFAKGAIVVSRHTAREVEVIGPGTVAGTFEGVEVATKTRPQRFCLRWVAWNESAFEVAA